MALTPCLQVDMMLYSLHQFPRTRLPGYTGYKPTEARNVTTFQPSQGAAPNTTYGFANQLRMKHGMPVQDRTNFLDSNRGIMGFFSGGGPFVSDNGKTESQVCAPLLHHYHEEGQRIARSQHVAVI